MGTKQIISYIIIGVKHNTYCKLLSANADEQQNFVQGLSVNAKIKKPQSQAAIPDKCKIQKKGDAKLYRKILTQTKKSEVRIILLVNPIHSGKFCRGM